MKSAQDLGRSAAQVPADAVKTAAAEAKNALDLAKGLLETATNSSVTTADQVIDQVASHIDTAYQEILMLLNLAQKTS